MISSRVRVDGVVRGRRWCYDYDNDLGVFFFSVFFFFSLICEYISYPRVRYIVDRGLVSLYL